MRKWILALIIVLLTVGTGAHAQTTLDQNYDSPHLGLSFSYPTGWDVEQFGNALITCDPSDLALLASKNDPIGLVIRFTQGPRSDFGLTESQSLPELLATLPNLGTSSATTIATYPALTADQPDNKGGAFAIRISEQRWVLIQTQSPDWADDKPLFSEIIDTLVFGPVGVSRVARTTAIKYGAKLHQVFATGESVLRFTFEAKISEKVTITAVADKDDPVDPAIVLIGSDSNVVAQNDDSLDPAFGLTNARLVNFPIPRSGTYTLEIHRTGTAGSGFTLTLDNKPTN
jgi:hypothetical protein